MIYTSPREEILLKMKGEGKKETEEVPVGRLDPFVARELARESTETQRFVLTILQLLKIFAKNIK